jgi:hypothetical protein
MTELVDRANLRRDPSMEVNIDDCDGGEVQEAR